MSFKRIVLIFILCFSIENSLSAQLAGNSSWVPPELSSEEKVYFSKIYQDTWNYFAEYTEPSTGVPFDSSARQPATSMSNVGYYLAVVSIGYRTGLISREQSLDRIEAVLDSLDKVEKWRGFPRPWILVRSLNATHGDQFTYDTHLSVLIGGLVLARTTFGEMRDRIAKMLSDMQFNDLYDKHTGWLKGGYDMRTNNFAIYQPWGRWYYKYFASGVRLLSFYGIAKGLIPREHWATMIRPVREEEGERFYFSGYEEPGLNDQYIAGLFLDERQTEMGTSQRGYVQYQMKHAQKIKAPAWGWGSCLTPNGRYLGAGELRDDILAPHASVLASIFYPAEVYSNMKVMEAWDMRPSVQKEATTVNFGCRDSINWKTGDVAKHHLTPSQGMTFLTLANLLFDGIVWRSFKEDTQVEDHYDLLSYDPTKLPEIETKITDVEKI